MRTALSYFVGVLGVLAITVTVGVYFRSQTPGGGGGPAMLAGAPAQSYTIKDVNGRDDALDHYRGKVVLVNLWATWCPPCRNETPALERLYERNKARGLVVLGIDQGESASTASAFARQLGLSYPILVDQDQQYGRAYSAIGLPTTLVVDRHGKIVVGHDGELTLAELQATVNPVLHAQ